MSNVGPSDHDHDQASQTLPQSEPSIPSNHPLVVETEPAITITGAIADSRPTIQTQDLSPPSSSTIATPSILTPHTSLKSQPQTTVAPTPDTETSPTLAPIATKPMLEATSTLLPDPQSTLPLHSQVVAPASLTLLTPSTLASPIPAMAACNPNEKLLAINPSIPSTLDRSISSEHQNIKMPKSILPKIRPDPRKRINSDRPVMSSELTPKTDPSDNNGKELSSTQVQTNMPSTLHGASNVENSPDIAPVSGLDHPMPPHQSHAIEDVASLPSVILHPTGSSPLKRKAEDALETPLKNPDSTEAEADQRPTKRRNIQSPLQSAMLPADQADAILSPAGSENTGAQTKTLSEDAQEKSSPFPASDTKDGNMIQDSTMTEKEAITEPNPDADAQDQGDTSVGNAELGDLSSSQNPFNKGQDSFLEKELSPEKDASLEKDASPPASQQADGLKQLGEEPDGSEKKSETEYVLPPDRPLPRNLPRVAKNRPENARVFIGNLASEYTDVTEIVKVFHKYGTLIEEPVLRRSFGFVQYSCAEAAKAAVVGEQSRMIGGIPIDLSIADNREVRKGAHVVNNTPFSHTKPGAATTNRTGRTRERESSGQAFTARKKRRSVSPSSSARKGGVHPPQFGRQRPEPRNGTYLRILCMSPTARIYARHCEHTFRTMTSLKADVNQIVAAGLGDALGRAMREIIPYVMVVASKDVEDGTCTIRTLEKTGYEKSGRGNGVIPLREAVEVCLIERGILVPNDMVQAQQYGGGSGSGNAAGGTAGAGGGAGRSAGTSGGYNSRGGMVGTAQWLTQGNQQHGQDAGLDSGKPSWMRGPRAPHPANVRMQAGGGQGGSVGQAGMSGGNGGNANGSVGGYAYGGMDGGRGGGYGQGGLGMGGAVAAGGLGGPPQGLMPPSGRGEMYTAGAGMGGGYGGANSGGNPNVGQDYGRGTGPMAYGSAGGTPQGGNFGGRYGSQGMGVRVGNYGSGGNREGEYDPASVVPGTRSGGYGEWNRDAEAIGRDMYGGGGMTGGNVGGREHENGAYGGSAMNGQQQQQAPQQAQQQQQQTQQQQQYRGVAGYGAGGGGVAAGSVGGPQAYSGDQRFAQSGVNDGGQGGMYGAVGEMGSSQAGYDMRNVYGGGSYGDYGVGMGYRSGSGGAANLGAPQQAQGQTQGRLERQQTADLGRFAQNAPQQGSGGYGGDGSGRGGYQQQHAPETEAYGGREQQARWASDNGAGAGAGAGTDAAEMGMHGAIGALGNSSNASNAYGVAGRGAAAHSAGGNEVRRGVANRGSGGGGPGMDIDKLSNLITAFTQKQQQGGSGAQASGGGQQQTAQGHPPSHEQSGVRSASRGGGGSGGSGTRLTAGGMSQILADPAVQQALQNIGGAGRLSASGGSAAGGAGGAGAAAMSARWHGAGGGVGGSGGGGQSSVGLSGGRGGRNDGQAQHGGAGINPSAQGYYR